MASHEYGSVCDEIYKLLKQRLERKNDDRFRFAPRGSAAKILREETLRRFFRTLGFGFADGIINESHHVVDEDTFVARVNERKYHDFLATLIFATCSLAAARHFVTKCIMPTMTEEDESLDITLPASYETLKILFERYADIDRFVEKQAIFCTVVLRKREEVRIESLSQQRVPYVDETPLAEGSFGKVFRVKIAKGHFRNNTSDGFKYNSAYMIVARKDYLMSDDFPPASEREIMEKILNSSAGTCKNIVKNLGSLAIGTKMYSLFMPLAICDLRVYMMENRPVRPDTVGAKADFIRCAMGLARGLKFLHSEMRTDDSVELVCYHLDLKPSNVLIYREAGPGGQSTFIWKLSDFGMARVKERRRVEGPETENDVNRWFKIRHPVTPDPSTSGTLNRRFDGTYLPPEALVKRSMGKGSDVWSLGCILSVLFVYLEDGAEGVSKYSDARSDHRRADGKDCFYVKANFRPTAISPVVREFHADLVKKSMRRNIKESEAIATVLRLLEEKVFHIEPSHRCTADTVFNALNEAFKQYRDLRDEISSTGGPRSPRAPQKRGWKDRIKRRESHENPKAQVEPWYLSSSDPFKGCTISPDAALVAYWNDTKIVLYSTPRSNKPTDPTSEYELERDDCVWKSVDLMGSYLVACTTGANCCYIFDLQKGPTADVSLQYCYIIYLQVSSIHHIALSSDGERIACLVWTGGNDMSCSILHATVERLIEWSKRRKSSLPDGSALAAISSHDGQATGVNAAVGSDDGPWSAPISLDWPASYVTYVSITDHGNIYCTVRPELTARSLEHTIPIVKIDTSGNTIDTLKIESRGFDGSGPVGFFTAFCLVKGEEACAVVTREKRIHISAFETSRSPSYDTQKDIAHYRIVKLITSPEDGRIFALGSTSAKHKMLLLEIVVPQSRADVVVTELAQLPGLNHGDDLSVTLSDNNGEKYFIIASLVGTPQRLVYGVTVDAPTK